MANEHTSGAPKNRPDPRPMRLAFGLAGVAALTAMATAMVSPAGPPAVLSATAQDASAANAATPTPQVIHIKRVITLQPGQTPPPQAIVTQLPAPKPRVVTIVTSQSGVVIP